MKTVLLTGASSFIGKHVTLCLLARGFRVRGSVRSDGRAAELRAVVPKDRQDQLSTICLDLEQDAEWETAAAGTDAVIHTASPFPMAQPKDEQALIRPAVDGTLRALRAARSAGVARVILTSSVAAIKHTDLADGQTGLDEADWTDPAHPTATAYARSKTLAERAAWEFVASEPGMALTAINPTLVAGPALDHRFGTSLALIERLLAGRDPMVPRIQMGIVDVRDVAEMHVRALERPATAGRRYAAVAREMWLADLARLVKAAAPGARVPTRQAPNILIRTLALFDRTIASISPSLGVDNRISSDAARRDLGIEFRPAAETIADTVAFLRDRASGSGRPKAA